MTTAKIPSLDSLEKPYWWQHLDGYHWYVLLICALGWMFDCADQMIFTSSRSIAMADLIHTFPAGYHSIDEYRSFVGTWATTLFMIGWASGGLFFGVIGDKWGRAKTMALTIFLYALCTGLSALAQNWQQFAIFRLITGIGVGGEFAAGASLVADIMPAQARAQALGLLQALSALGNIVGAFLLQVSSALAHGSDHWKWRYLYWFGTVPALLSVVVMSRMREPDKWIEAKKAAKAVGGKSMGRISDLFTDARWRRNTLVGLALAISGVVGLWGIGFYSPELIDASFPKMSVQTGAHLEAAMEAKTQAARGAAIATFDSDDRIAYVNLLNRTSARHEKLSTDLAAAPMSAPRKARIDDLLAHRMTKRASDTLKSNGLMIQQVGAFLGMLMFSILAVRIGRRWTFAISFLAAWASIYIVFLGLHDRSQVWYLYPLLGFCTLLPFGGYAVYFPELFPTRLRTTGTGFCYNVGRYVASLGPLAFGGLLTLLAGRFQIASFRVAAVVIASVYIVGIIAAFAGPETKDQPLPEDQRVAVH